MTDADWLTGTHSAELLRAARGRVSHRKLRLLAVACCRRHEDLIQAKRSAGLRRRIELAEGYADGAATPADLSSTFPPEERGRRERSLPTPLNTIRWAIYTLGWPDAEQPNYGFDEATREFTRRPWRKGEYAEHYTLRPMLHAAHAASRRRRGDFRAEMDRESAAQADLVRCIIPNPFRPVAFDPGWRTPAAVALARQMYDARDFAHAPILADALEDAGCTDPDVLGHLRGPGPHARGCWPVDLVLGRE